MAWEWRGGCSFSPEMLSGLTQDYTETGVPDSSCSLEKGTHRRVPHAWFVEEPHSQGVLRVKRSLVHRPHVKGKGGDHRG